MVLVVPRGHPLADPAEPVDLGRLSGNGGDVGAPALDSDDLPPGRVVAQGPKVGLRARLGRRFYGSGSSSSGA
jgi:hypothetical protein